MLYILFFCTHTFHYFLLLGPSLFWTTFCSQDDFSDGSCDWQDCLHVGSTAWTSGDGGNLASKRLEPAAGRKRWASWKKGPFLLFRGFVGDELLPSLRGDYNGCKDPYETTRIQWKVRGVFFVAQMGQVWWGVWSVKEPRTPWIQWQSNRGNSLSKNYTPRKTNMTSWKITLFSVRGDTLSNGRFYIFIFSILVFGGVEHA